MLVSCLAAEHRITATVYASPELPGAADTAGPAFARSLEVRQLGRLIPEVLLQFRELAFERIRDGRSRRSHRRR